MRALQTTEVTKVCDLLPQQNKVLALKELFLTFLWEEFCDQIILNVVFFGVLNAVGAGGGVFLEEIQWE